MWAYFCSKLVFLYEHDRVVVLNTLWYVLVGCLGFMAYQPLYVI